MVFLRGSTQSQRLPDVNVFPEDISESWRGFLLSIDPKPKAVWSCSFSSYRSRSLERFSEKRIDQKPKVIWTERFFRLYLWALKRLFAGDQPKAEGGLARTFFRGTSPKAGGFFCEASTKSRRSSGATLFRVIAAGLWRDFSKRIDQKLEAVWSYTFSGHRSGPLERFSEKD